MKDLGNLFISFCHFLAVKKTRNKFWFCDLFIFKRQFIYSSLKGIQSSMLDMLKAPFVNRRYTKEVPFQSKMVYKKVRVLTLGWDLPI